MASPLRLPVPTPEPDVRVERVLIVRSCRQARFAAAVARARKEYPGAEIVALSHRSQAAGVKATGVHRVIEVPGDRFGLWRLSPVTLRRLRRDTFDVVVIPQMTAHAREYVNVYWLAAVLRSNRFVVLPGDEAPRVFDRRSLLWFAYGPTIVAGVAVVDAPLLLLLLVWSVLRRMGSHRPLVSGRRRVLFIISSLGVGGAQVQLAGLINRLPRDVFDVDLLVLGNDGGFSRQWLERDDVRVECLEHWPHLTESVFEIASRCRQGRYDLVHTWLFMANVVGVAGARLAGVPLVIASVRNLSVWKRETWYRKWWFRAADVLGSNAADLVTVNAHALVADHSRWAFTPSSRFDVVHNGLDPSKFLADRRASRRMVLDAIGANDDAVVVGTVGRLAPEKDQATFLAVLARVRQRHPDVVGVIVGGGELRGRLEQLAGELGLGSGVVFLGERSDARRLMAGFDVFALTSRSEGFPNVLLEATFFGVPCVATDVAGNPDVLGTDAALFPPGDADAGAACLEALLADRRAASDRAHAARQRALRLFTADRTVETWLDVYRRAFARQGSRGIEAGH